MSIVRGENVILSFYHNGTWKPLACAKTCTLTTNSKVAETSTKTSGNWESYMPVKLGWTASCGGLVSYDMNLAVSELRAVQYSLAAILIRFLGTDANSLTEEFSGFAIVTSVVSTSVVKGNYEYSVELLGSGDPFGIPDIINPCDCVVLWYYYNATGGEFNTGPIAELVGKDIDGRIYRDGIEFRPSGIFHDGTGTPGDKEYAFDPATGTISFDPTGSSLEPDETVDIPYIVCGEQEEECVAVQVTGDVTLPDGTVGVAYSEVVTLTGTAPFELANIVKPAWMTIAISGSNVNITGTPNAEGTGITVSFDVTNCTDDSDSFSDTINITESPTPEATLTFGFTTDGGFNSFTARLSVPVDDDLTINRIFADGYDTIDCSTGTETASAQINSDTTILAGQINGDVSPEIITGDWSLALSFQIYNVRVNTVDQFDGFVITVGSYQVTIVMPACEPL